MVKTLTALTAAGVIATAAVVTVPNKAEAYPAWVIPAIVVGAVGGVALGAAATAHADSYAYSPGPVYAPAGAVYVQPRAARAAASCQIVRERTASGAIRRVQVCQ
jgi:hypothetical protein